MPASATHRIASCPPGALSGCVALGRIASRCSVPLIGEPVTHRAFIEHLFLTLTVTCAIERTSNNVCICRELIRRGRHLRGAWRAADARSTPRCSACRTRSCAVDCVAARHRRRAARPSCRPRRWPPRGLQDAHKDSYLYSLIENRSAVNENESIGVEDETRGIKFTDRSCNCRMLTNWIP